MIYFLLGIPIYALAASLPLIYNIKGLSITQYYVAGFILAGIGAMVWLTMARYLNPSQVSLWGLKWDIMITLCYFIVPFLFVRQEINQYNIIGIVLALSGIILLKV
jgi:drug/metabolite transporter (DMT)-like permease